MKPRLLVVLALISIAGSLAAARPREGAPQVCDLAAVRFELGSANLAARNVRELAEAGAWAAAHSDGVLVVAGHADLDEPSRRGARLSLARAKAVRDELIAIGVDEHQIVVAGFARASVAAGPTVFVWGTRASRAVRRSDRRSPPAPVARRSRPAARDR